MVRLPLRFIMAQTPSASRGRRCRAPAWQEPLPLPTASREQRSHAPAWQKPARKPTPNAERRFRGPARQEHRRPLPAARPRQSHTATRKSQNSPEQAEGPFPLPVWQEQRKRRAMLLVPDLTAPIPLALLLKGKPPPATARQEAHPPFHKPPILPMPAPVSRKAMKRDALTLRLPARQEPRRAFRTARVSRMSARQVLIPAS